MAETTPTPDLKTYKGNCHCGAFKFSIQVPELTSVMECNCSICFRKGYKWVFPGAGCFTIEKGDGTLKDYEFGACSMAHKFCPTCGTGIMGKRHGMATGMDIGVNARALQDVDLWSLNVNKYNGAALEPAYKPPPFTGPEPEAEIENSKLYTGSCHCGAVTLALKTRGPLSKEVEVIGECDCSICARHGRVLTYRPLNQISRCLSSPEIGLSSYAFASKRFEHKFCPVCGVAVGVDDVQNPKGEELRAVNVRCLEGVEWEDIWTRIWREPGWRAEPMYVVPE